MIGCSIWPMVPQTSLSFEFFGHVPSFIKSKYERPLASWPVYAKRYDTHAFCFDDQFSIQCICLFWLHWGYLRIFRFLWGESLETDVWSIDISIKTGTYWSQYLVLVQFFEHGTSQQRHDLASQLVGHVLVRHLVVFLNFFSWIQSWVLVYIFHHHWVSFHLKALLGVWRLAYLYVQFLCASCSQVINQLQQQ